MRRIGPALRTWWSVSSSSIWACRRSSSPFHMKMATPFSTLSLSTRSPVASVSRAATAEESATQPPTTALSLGSPGPHPLTSRWPEVPFTAQRQDVADQAMNKALFDAEVARCKGDAGQAELWQDAVEKCDAAGSGGRRPCRACGVRRPGSLPEHRRQR
jgi:hypothetical protein